MRRLFRLLALLVAVTVVAAIGCSRTLQEAPARAAAYTNPVYAGGEDGLGESPDPGPLKYKGEFYVYVTGGPCQVLKSADLVSWTLLGNMMDESTSCYIR